MAGQPVSVVSLVLFAVICSGRSGQSVNPAKTLQTGSVTVPDVVALFGFSVKSRLCDLHHGLATGLGPWALDAHSTNGSDVIFSMRKSTQSHSKYICIFI